MNDDDNAADWLNGPALLHRLALLFAAESERAIAAEDRLEQMTRERDELQQRIHKLEGKP
jgi:cell division protein FtsB